MRLIDADELKRSFFKKKVDWMFREWEGWEDCSVYEEIDKAPTVGGKINIGSNLTNNLAKNYGGR